jgi:hypothetical protein
LAKNANTSSTGYGTHCCVSKCCVMCSMVSPPLMAERPPGAFAPAPVHHVT